MIMVLIKKYRSGLSGTTSQVITLNENSTLRISKEKVTILK